MDSENDFENITSTNSEAEDPTCSEEESMSEDESDHEDCPTCSEEEPMSEDETPTTSDEEFIVSDEEEKDSVEELIEKKRKILKRKINFSKNNSKNKAKLFGEFLRD